MIYTVISIIFISIIGTISHYTYDMTNHNKVIGLFSAVNESTWEHIKIALTPTFIWSFIDGLKFGGNQNYFLAKFISLIIIILLIPLLYYGYRFLFKKDIWQLNILIFYITIIISQIVFHKIVELEESYFILNYFSCIGIIIIFGGYMIHTIMPGNHFLFKDPITKKYGFKGHIK